MTIQERIMRALEEGPHSISELTAAVYGDKAPKAAREAIRTQIQRINAKTSDGINIIVSRGNCHQARWYLVKPAENADAPAENAGSTVDLNIDEDFPYVLTGKPRHYPVRSDRFYGNAQPRWGK